MPTQQFFRYIMVRTS